MKTTKLIAMAMVGLTLSFTPALAQRGGGGSTRGGGSHSSSSVSRSSGGFSGGSSRGSSFSGSSSRSSSYSSPSRSSSSRSSSSFSSPSRSSSSSRSSSYSSPRRSSASSSRSSASMPSRSAYSSGERGSRSAAASARSSAVRAQGSADGFRSSSRAGATRSSAVRGADGQRSGAPAGSGRVATAGRGTSSHGTTVHRNAETRSGGYARPGHPGGVMPPSHRPIRPAPYFHHPWHGYVVHCRPIYWHPVPPRPWYWPGFWHYCHSYWYDYHVTDVVVVRQYVQETYKVDMITYGISGDIMYAIVRDDGDTYLQVYDKDDHLLAEQKIHRKYCNMVIDPDNGGAWISKKGNKDALLFIWAEGQLLIYEAE